MVDQFQDTSELKDFRNSLTRLSKENRVIFVLAEYGVGKTENTTRALSNEGYKLIDLSNATSLRSSFFIINGFFPYILLTFF